MVLCTDKFITAKHALHCSGKRWNRQVQQTGSDVSTLLHRSCDVLDSDGSLIEIIHETNSGNSSKLATPPEAHTETGPLQQPGLFERIFLCKIRCLKTRQNIWLVLIGNSSAIKACWLIISLPVAIKFCQSQRQEDILSQRRVSH